jgi:uncharacterized protein (TIGR00725 family)
MMAKMKMQIGVIGSKDIYSGTIWEAALKVGGEIARAGAILVCGGLTGIMEASAKGAKEAGGTTIGIIPGNVKSEANRFIDIVIATGIGYARNTIVATTSDAVIMIAGGLGTMSEAAFALNLGKPVIALKGTGGVADLLANKEIDGNPVLSASSPAGAVRLGVEKASRK